MPNSNSFTANTLASPPDQRDILFVPRKGIQIADSLDLLPEVFELEDQENLGSCVPNGIGSQCESRLLVAGRPRDLSRLALYTMARKRMGWLNNPQEGLVTRECLQTAYKLGMCDEADYPYDTSLRQVDPPQAIYDLAAPTRIDRYEAVVPPGSYGWGREKKIDMVLAANNERLQVGFAMPVTDSLRHLAGPWQTHQYSPVDATHPSIGGHYQVNIGYDLSIRKFLVQGSWGTKKKDGTPYGDGGFVGLPFSMVDDALFEAWIIRSFDGAEIPEQPGIKLELVNRYRLECRIVPLRSELGTSVDVWAGAMLDGKFYMKTSEADTWGLWDGATMQPFRRGMVLEQDNPIKVVTWMDMAKYAGAEVYVAFGTSPLTWTIERICVLPVIPS